MLKKCVGQSDMFVKIIRIQFQQIFSKQTLEVTPRSHSNSIVMMHQQIETVPACLPEVRNMCRF